MTIETHTMTPPDNGATVNVNQELVDYLKTRPEIRPLRATFRDATWPANIIGFTSSACTLPSAWIDPINGHYRAAQGISALISISIQTYLQLKGRYQTYTDLRDLQRGVDPAMIVKRADMEDKSLLGRFESWWMANSVNVTAVWAIGNCGLMATSGIASHRPGETATAVLWVPTYLLRLLPEKSVSANAVKKTSAVMDKIASMAIVGPFNLAAKALSNTTAYKAIANSWIAQQPPLVLSAIYNVGFKRIPAITNAVIAHDPYSVGWMLGGVAQDIFTAEIDKRFIGRGNGSIVNSPDGHIVARNILEGRGLRTLKEMLSPRAV